MAGNDYFKHQVTLTTEGVKWFQSAPKNVFGKKVLYLVTSPTRTNDTYIVTQFTLYDEKTNQVEVVSAEIPFIGEDIEESIACFLFPSIDLLRNEKLYRQAEQDWESITFKILDKELFIRNMSGLRTDYLYEGRCNAVIKDMTTNKYYLDMDGSPALEEMRPYTMQTFFDNLLTEEKENDISNDASETSFDIDPIKIDINKNGDVVLTLSIDDLFDEDDFSSSIPMRNYTTENGITIYYGYKGERKFCPLICDDQIWFGSGETTVKDTVDKESFAKIIAAWGEFRDYLAATMEM